MIDLCSFLDRIRVKTFNPSGQMSLLRSEYWYLVHCSLKQIRKWVFYNAMRSFVCILMSLYWVLMIHVLDNNQMRKMMFGMQTFFLRARLFKREMCRIITKVANDFYFIPMETDYILILKWVLLQRNYYCLLRIRIFN